MLFVFFVTLISGCGPLLSPSDSGEISYKVPDRAPVVQSITFSKINCGGDVRMSPAEVSIKQVYQVPEKKEIVEEVFPERDGSCVVEYKVYATDDFGIVSVDYDLKYVGYQSTSIESKKSNSEALKSEEEIFWYENSFVDLNPGKYTLKFSVEDNSGNVDTLTKSFFVY